MSDSWDWVEKKTKTQRKRTIAKAGVCIVIAWFVFQSYGMTKHDDAATNERRNVSVAGPGIQDNPQQDAIQPDSPPPEIEATVAFSNPATEVTREERNEVQVGEYKEIQEQVKDILGLAPKTPKWKPAPLPEMTIEPSAESLLQAKNALKSLEDRLKKVKETDFPTNYSNLEWAEFESLLEFARAADAPKAILAKTEEAEKLLQKMIPDIRYQAFRQAARGLSLSEQLHSLHTFRRSNPNHPQLPNLESTIGNLDYYNWLEIAANEMRAASPDEGGFVDGWLPIAGAWQLYGKDIEAREAIRQAKQAIPRIATAERAIESTIDLCLHESSARDDAKRLISDAEQLCDQVSDGWVRSSYFARLSGLAKQLGHDALSASLLHKSTSIIVDGNSKNGYSKKAGQPLVLAQRCRAGAWTESPDQIFAMCQQMERDPNNQRYKLTIALGYIHAAKAAARQANQTAFLKAMFEAETILASVNHQESPNYKYTPHLALANMLQRRWRAAVIVANNIPAPTSRDPILLQILSVAPQEVYAKDVRRMLASSDQIRYAAPAIAGYVEHQYRSGESLLALLDWIYRLPKASQRASAFAGIARVASDRSQPSETTAIAHEIRQPSLDSSIELVESAESLASQLEDSVESAFTWLQIARCWNSLGKPARYRTAVANLHDRCFETWITIWDARPDAKLSFDGTYSYSSSSSHRKRETYLVGRIVACLRHLSELQADIGDAKGAMDTSLYLANAAGFSGGSSNYLNLNFLHLEAISNRLKDQTGVGSEAFTPFHDEPRAYARSIIAAWSDDIPGVKREIVKLGERGRIVDRTQAWHIARAYGELAILYAERANLDEYRKARRSAMSEINARRAPNDIKLMLALADAKAGELALAESNLVFGSVEWFGEASRPRSELARALAEDGQWENAMKHAQQIPEKFPIYRGDAWEAVARSRRKVSSSHEELQSWAESHDSPVIKIAILCGFALAAE